jgi:2'-5' RNA ligase
MTNRRPENEARLQGQPTERTGTERLRLFVAIELPETWKQALERLQRDMQAALSRDPDLSQVHVRWVRPEGIHLTLKFLGEVPASRLEKIDWALKSAVPALPNFTLSLGRAGSFSDRRAPSVVWAGILDRPLNESDLGALVERVETWFAAASFPREKRSFAPHLTLARLPTDLAVPARQRVADITGRVAAPDAPPFAVERVSLMRSFLERSGARYERLAGYPA